MTGADPQFTYEELNDLADAVATHIDKLKKLYVRGDKPTNDETRSRTQTFLNLRSKLINLAAAMARTKQ